MLSGTKEGTKLVSLLAGKGYKVLALMATAHGTKLVSDITGVMVKEPVRSQAELLGLCLDCKIAAVIDATHPVANELSKWAKQVCDNRKLTYIRFVREETEVPDNPLINVVYSWEEAVVKAASFGKNIFLTTGSNNLEVFLDSDLMKGKRLIVRVLPDYKIIQKCQNLGIPPKDIVAMQGPFSKEMNKATFKMYGASAIVTKDSGKAGGTDTKISAALSLGIPVVLLRRSSERNADEVTECNEVLTILKN